MYQNSMISKIMCIADWQNVKIQFNLTCSMGDGDRDAGKKNKSITTPLMFYLNTSLSHKQDTRLLTGLHTHTHACARTHTQIVRADESESLSLLAMKKKKKKKQSVAESLGFNKFALNT